MNRNTFLAKHGIHQSFYDFFTEDIVEDIVSKLKEMKKDFYPKSSDIFKVFRNDLKKVKIVILGLDPYPQKGAATGRAFELEKSSWEHHQKINSSLINIVKVINKVSSRKIETIKQIRNKISEGHLQLSPPNKYFKKLEDQGVFLLNSALTVETGKPKSHLDSWETFTTDLLQYISKRHRDITYFLWGQDVLKFKKVILSGNIFTSHHPSRLGSSDNSSSFRNTKCFQKTFNIIKWIC
jgi:uracil-DNA glycosylase